MFIKKKNRDVSIGHKRTYKFFLDTEFFSTPSVTLTLNLGVSEYEGAQVHMPTSIYKSFL